MSDKKAGVPAQLDSYTRNSFEATQTPVVQQQPWHRRNENKHITISTKQLRLMHEPHLLEMRATVYDALHNQERSSKDKKMLKELATMPAIRGGTWQAIDFD